MPSCTFELMSSGQMSGTLDESTRILLYLYRITVNQHSRLVQKPSSNPDAFVPLGLDLHFLLTAWSSNPFDEQVTLAWVVRQLHHFPVLDASALSPEADWGGDEVIQIIPAELTTEDIMRVWEAMKPSYRLSTSYVARVVRLDPDSEEDGALPVVASSLRFGEEVAE